MAPYKIIKQGYMLKEPPPSKRGLRKKLFRYWFVLLEDKKQVAFVYYKNEDAYIERQRNVGFMQIDQSSVNVVGEYMGHKNAFSIAIPRTKYILIPESRYELHDWIFVIHNTLESFHRRLERVKARQEQRLRALSSGNLSSVAVPATPTTAIETTPTRHAHNSPNTPRHAASQRTPNSGTPNSSGTPQSVASSGSSGSSRRPKRPAPAAPRYRDGQAGSPGQSRSGSSLYTSNTTPSSTPLVRRQTSQDAAMFGSQSEVSTVSFGMESGQHPVMDLVIEQYGESQREGDEEGEGEREGEEVQHGGGELATACELPGEAGEGREDEEISSSLLHPHCDSSPHLGLSRKSSSSLPDLNQRDSSVSPEDDEVAMREREIERAMATAAREREEGSRRSESPISHRRPQHTRHLSLTEVTPGVKLSKRRRNQPSVKGRSRSPPNYPPPPPPGGEESEREASWDPEEGGEEGHHTTGRRGGGGEGEGGGGGGIDTDLSRKESLGFSQVMSTVANTGQEVEELATNIESPSTHLPPQPWYRRSNSTQSPVKECPTEEEEEEEEEQEEEERERERETQQSPLATFQGSGAGEFALKAATEEREEREERERKRNDDERVWKLQQELLEKHSGPRHFEEEEVTSRTFFPEPQREDGTITNQEAERGEGEGDGGERSSGEFDGHRLSSEEGTAMAPPAPIKPKPKRSRVMFREDTEDIPTYEPRIDQEMPPSEVAGGEPILSTVAALKMMLFGEGSTKKYTKDGPMSLRHGAIVDAQDYDPDLHAMLSPGEREASLSPNDQQKEKMGQQRNSITPSPHEGSRSPQGAGMQGWRANSTSPAAKEGWRKSASLSPQDRGTGPHQQLPGMRPEDCENEYDAPWDNKAFSKFAVISHRRKAPVAMQRRDGSTREQASVERVEFPVTSHTTATPGSMERRNVQSLERQKKWRIPAPPAPPLQQKPPLPPGRQGGSLERGGRLVSPTQSLERGGRLVSPTQSLGRGGRIVSPTQSPQLLNADSDLLKSINSTLQNRSKYGSDSFLSLGAKHGSSQSSHGGSPDHQQPPQGPLDSAPNAGSVQVMAAQRGGMTSPQNGGPLNHPQMLSRSQQSMDSGRGSRGGRGGGGGRVQARGGFAGQKNPRLAQSVDGLQGNVSTHVVYDQVTNSHTFRSLV